MSRKRFRRKPLEHAAPAARTVSIDNLSSGRKWLFRFLAVFIVPALLLGGVELCLRVAGFGFDPHFFRKEQVAGRECYVANEDFGRRFFPERMVRFPPPLVMAREKPPETFRIFIFGESAALGDPRPNYGAGNYLAVLLAERFPQAKFEIVNTSVTAINSHAILPIARECASHAGDLWIVYMGNNEMVGPFGAATVFGVRAPPVSWVRLQLQLRRLRLSQLLLASALKLQGAAPADGAWQGMEMFMQNQLRPDDPGKQRAYRNFERNLDDILKAGRNADARIVLSTVAVNQKDCPPFGSLSETNLPPDARGTFARLNQEAAAAQSQGRWSDARAALEPAAEIFPQAAQNQFELANALLRLTNTTAREHFLQAVDRDTLPFRADSRINETIRATARRWAGDSLRLCDADQALAARSPEGICGEELFYEHVHLNPEGNYALARAWAEQVEKLLPAALTRDARPAWATASECAQWLGLTDWNRASILEEVLQRLQRPPFIGQSGHAQRLAELRSDIAAQRERLTDTAAIQARETYLRALRRDPENFRLHEAFAEFLEATHDSSGAVAARRKVCELTPYFYFSHYTLGVAWKEAGELGEARAALQRALTLKADDSDSWLELGIISARQGDWERALRELESARKLRPSDPRCALFLGEVLWKLNRRSEAVANLREAIRLNPADWQPHYRLAQNLTQQGSLPEAVAEYQEVLRLNPANVRARLGLAAILPNMGRREEALQLVREALQLEPTNRTALELDRRIRGN